MKYFALVIGFILISYGSAVDFMDMFKDAICPKLEMSPKTHIPLREHVTSKNLKDHEYCVFS
jgi:hypothetical protein